MNQKKIDEMIPIALEYLASLSISEKTMKSGEYEIRKVYFGYIASFGPSVIQAGIAKTLAFYYKAKGEGEGDRQYIVDFIKHVFIKAYSSYEKDKGETLLSLYDTKIKKEGFTTLQRLALADKILEAAIACKLAMNTYHAEEKQ